MRGVGAYADDGGGCRRDREYHSPVRTNVTRKSFPFRLDRASASSFRRQLAEGVREAIRTGYYKSADVLPSLSQGVAELGVSDIVVRGAYRTLAAEGLVVPRKGIGSIVRPPKTPIWSGHVLCVMMDFDFNVSQCGIVGSLRDCLTANGYSFSQVLCLTARDGKQDLAGLETALCRPLDFAVLVAANDEIERRLSRSGIPFAVVGRRADDILPGCIGGIEVSKVRGLRRLVAKCCTRGIRRVEIVCCKRISPEADLLMAELTARGIDVAIGWVKDLWGVERVEAAERTGYEFVRRNLRKRLPRWPDLYYVSDDYVARGMLQAFAAFGVRVPEDMRFVCSACAGFHPVFGAKRVAVLESAPYRYGAEIARRVLGWLTDHRPFTSAPLEHTFVEGDTFP